MERKSTTDSLENGMKRCSNEKCWRILPTTGEKCVCEVISTIEKVPWRPGELKCLKCVFYSEGERQYPVGWSDSWCEQTCSKGHYSKLYSDNYDDYRFMWWYSSTCKDYTEQVPMGGSMCCRIVFNPDGTIPMGTYSKKGDHHGK